MSSDKRSWVVSANDPASDFPLQNLPYGVFLYRARVCIGIAIGDSILDLRACADEGHLAGLSSDILNACRSEYLNDLMALDSITRSSLRQRITSLLDADTADAQTQMNLAELLVPMADATMQLPARIGDYTDFYASIHHATRVGKLFRPDSPLLPNYKHIPIGYHGRASSIVVSGKPIRRPCGQTKSPDSASPSFGPTRSLDYELEVGIFVGPGNPLGDRVPIAEAEEHIFGFCLLNDWSARDIQAWEYQPLGPFLAKSFATTISPWVVTLEALEPYRVAATPRHADDPTLLPYLDAATRAFDITLEVFLQSPLMRYARTPPFQLSSGNLNHLYWTPAQLLTHHTSNGCNLRPGDLLGTGTISGPEVGSEGCLLEKQQTGPIKLPSGETRTFLENGDEIIFRAFAHKPGLPRIGFGTCTGVVSPATSVA